jgi:hypothetical protein
VNIRPEDESGVLDLVLGEVASGRSPATRLPPCRRGGEETLQGTACRLAAVTAGSAELAVWADDEHIRRIQRVYSVPGEQGSTTKSLTLDLWDFGVPVDELDWSRLPSFAGLA